VEIDMNRTYNPTHDPGFLKENPDDHGVPQELTEAEKSRLESIFTPTAEELEIEAVKNLLDAIDETTATPRVNDLANILSDVCSQYADKPTEECPACQIRDRIKEAT
jgi:hypothetical protein